MTEEKSQEAWMKTLGYVRKLRYGPPSEELEVLHILNTFYEFLAIQMLALYVMQMPAGERDGFVKNIRNHWRRSLRMHVNEQVKKHEEVLSKAPDAKHLVQFIGDGENMRMAASRQLRNADKKIEEMLNNLVKKIENNEGGGWNGTK